MKLKIVYAFDNNIQFNLFRKSITSLKTKNSNEKISFVFLLTEKFFTKAKNEIDALSKGYDYEVVQFPENYDFGLTEKSRNGMFFWLFAPFKIEADYILQLDNDTLISADLYDIFVNMKSKIDRNTIVASKTKINSKTTLLKSLKSLNLNNDKININLKKYTNYGVVFLNVKNYKKIFDDEKRLVEYLSQKTEIALKKSIVETDQEYMFEVFSERTAFLSKELNTRIHKTSTVCAALKKKNKIIHLNLWNGKTKTKFDFVDFLYSEENDQVKIERLWNFLSEKLSDEFRIPKFLISLRKRKFIKIINESIAMSKEPVEKWT